MLRRACSLNLAARMSLSLRPLPGFGAEARGVDLKNPLSDALAQQIREAVTKWVGRGAPHPPAPALPRGPPLLASPLCKCTCRHRLVIFRDQGVVSGERQVAISRLFGELESTFYKHPASPHPDVFRVSNDPQQGCTGGVGGGVGEFSCVFSLAHQVLSTRAPHSLRRRGADGMAH